MMKNKLKVPEFVFISLILSSCIFPSLLSGYQFTGFFSFITNRIPIFGYIFVIDEIIALFGLVPLLVYAINREKMSESIPIIRYTLLLTYIILSFLFAYFLRPDNSKDIVLISRWIVINMFYFLLPFSLQLNSKDIDLFLKNLIFITMYFAAGKLALYFIISSDSFVFSQISSDFAFFVNIACLLILISSRDKIIKTIGVVLCLAISFFSRQMSAMILSLLVIIVGFGMSASMKKKRINYFKIVSIFGLIIIFLVNIYPGIIDSLMEYFNLSILDYSLQKFQINKFNSYFIMWKTGILKTLRQSVLFGLGIGAQTTFYIPAWIGYGDMEVSHSLLHNIFVTFFHSFGLVGLFLLLWTLAPLLHKIPR